MYDFLHGTEADPGEGQGDPPPPLIFRPNWDPKGRKKTFLRPASLTPYLRVWMTGPPLSEGLDRPLWEMQE